MLVLTNNWKVEPDLKQRFAKINVPRLMVIIIEYLETTLFQNKYAKIDSNYHILLYDNYKNHKHNPQ